MDCLHARVTYEVGSKYFVDHCHKSSYIVILISFTEVFLLN